MEVSKTLNRHLRLQLHENSKYEALHFVGRVVKYIQMDSNTKGALLDFSPALPQDLLVRSYNSVEFSNYFPDGTFHRLLVAPRHMCTSLFPKLSKCPFHVYGLVPQSGGSWEEGPYHAAVWALLDEV